VERVLKALWLPALLVAICAWMAIDKTQMGEWMTDAGTAVGHLTRGEISAYFACHPMLGPLATLFQTPFAWLGHDPFSGYQWATFGCLLVTAVVAWWLGRVAAENGAGRLTTIAVPVLFLANPLAFEALRLGHPEESMTVALAIGAIVLAGKGRSWQAGVVLGLAIATKQWAALAIFPVLMAMPTRRAFSACVAGAVALVLNLPWMIANSGSFFTTQGAGAGVGGGQTASIWSVWRPLSTASERHLQSPGLVNLVHEVPPQIQPWTHPLIIACGFAIPLALWAWRGRFGLEPRDAIALFALILLLRCALDPNDNFYYHLPVLMALVTWDALAGERLPLRSLAGVVVAAILNEWSNHLGNLALFNLAYVAIVLAVGAAIAVTLLRRDRSDRESLRARRRPAMAAGRA
jgi:hypothetical protein